MRKITKQNVADFTLGYFYPLLYIFLFFGATLWLGIQPMAEAFYVISAITLPIFLLGIWERLVMLRTPRHWLLRNETAVDIVSYCKEKGITMTALKFKDGTDRQQYGFVYLEDMLQVKLAT